MGRVFSCVVILCIVALGLCGQRLCWGLDYIRCRPGLGGDLKTQADAPLVITIDVTRQRQTITGFGASDAWSTQFVGLWPDETRQAIARLLFETDLDGFNNPVGIGLSAWRFNIGAGSSRRSDIIDSWRKADTFLDESFDGYDWSRCPGQRWFLQAAKSRGVESFTAFVNSPPINMTRNGMAYCAAITDSTNLAWNKDGAFAEYLATILEHFRDVEGIEFDQISPFNEPNWQWDGNSQEGCRYSNVDIARVVKALYPELQARQLATEIEIPEAGEINYLFGNSTTSGDYIDAFFTPGSYTYIGNLVAPRVAGHSYFTGWPENNRLVGRRETLRDKLDQFPGLGYVMTEYCILITGDSYVPQQYRDYGSGRDLGIDPALWIARVIHHDLTIAEASGWYWWLGISPYDYKDGLVYVDKSVLHGDYYDSKMLWAMGNFSRFVRPGMKRIAIERSDNATPDDVTKDLMVSAYHKEDDDIVVAVLVNWTQEDKPVRFDWAGTGVRTLIPFVTRGPSNDRDNLTAYRALGPDDAVAIPARSIVTLVGLPTNFGDYDEDGKTDLQDFAALGAQWLGSRTWPDRRRIGFSDLAALAEYWLSDSRLIACWNLDEADGGVAIDSASGLDALVRGEPRWQPNGGHFGGALELDGAADYIETPFVLDPADAPFSVYAWVRGGGPGQVVISQVGTADWLLAETTTGHLMTDLTTGGRFKKALVSDNPIIDGNWHHIGFIWDGERRTLCFDGAEVATDTSALKTLAGSQGGLYIGAANDLSADAHWSGRIDNVCLYNRPVLP